MKLYRTSQTDYRTAAKQGDIRRLHDIAAVHGITAVQRTEVQKLLREREYKGCSVKG